MATRIPAALYTCVFQLPPGSPHVAQHWERGRAWTVEWRSVGIPPVGFDDAPAHARWRYTVHGIDAEEGVLLLVVRVRKAGDEGCYELRFRSEEGFALHSIRRVEVDGTESEVQPTGEAAWQGKQADPSLWQGHLVVGKRKLKAEVGFVAGDCWWREVAVRVKDEIALLGQRVPDFGINASFTPRWEAGTSWAVLNRITQLDPIHVGELREFQEWWSFRVEGPVEWEGTPCVHVTVRRSPDDPERDDYPVFHLYVSREAHTITAIEEEFGAGARGEVEVPLKGDTYVNIDRMFRHCFDLARLSEGYEDSARTIEMGGNGPTQQQLSFVGADEMNVEIRHPFRRDTLVVRQRWLRGAPWPVRCERVMELDDADPEVCMVAELLPSR